MYVLAVPTYSRQPWNLPTANNEGLVNSIIISKLKLEINMQIGSYK